jgi:hypothetical protein
MNYSNHSGVRKFKMLKAKGGRLKGYVGVTASAGLNAIEAGDRVNAELQHSPAIIEMRQIGVPAFSRSQRELGKDDRAVTPFSFSAFQLFSFSAFQLSTFP